MIPCTYISTLNSDKLGSSRNPLFIPFSNYKFYNNKEHGYFDLIANILDSVVIFM